MASADDDWYTDSEASDSEVSQGEDAQPDAQETRTTCDQCGKTRDSLKHCAKCKTTHYCDRDCQNAHWKTHKKECARLAGGEGASADGKVPKRSDAKPFTAIYHNNFLHHGTEKETFKILIDVIRMRQEDVYSLEALSPNRRHNGRYHLQRRTSVKAFKKFLRKAKTVPGFLPPWWSDEKAEECVRFGLRDADFNLANAREKSDIQEEWKDERMPKKVRMLGEKVYGNTPGGTRSDGIMGMMLMMEGTRV